MNCKTSRLFIVGLSLLAALSSTAWGAYPPQGQLLNQAELFLHLLDRQQYADAWAMTSPHFQTFNSDRDWQIRQKALRSAYGSLENRLFRSVNYRESYFRSPDGQYAIVQFTSHFRNKSRTVETIVFDCSDETCAVQEYILP